MKEKYINITLLGRAKEEKNKNITGGTTPGKRTQDIQYRYMWYNSNGAKKFMAVCRNGRVSSVVEFVSSTTSGKKTYRGNTSRNNDRKDMYDVQDYDDPEDFYMIMQMSLMIFRMRKITGRKHSRRYGILRFCTYTSREPVCFQAQKETLFMKIHSYIPCSRICRIRDSCR